MLVVAEVRFKYADEVGEADDCPPSVAFAADGEAYRWVMNPMSEECFFPAARKNPKRVLGKQEKEKCSLYALSMFNTLENARSRFLALEASVRNIRKTLGTHIARAELCSDDGIRTHPNSTGHFDFFETDGSDVKSKFRIVGEI